jgi:hypothetical protein
VKQKKNKGYIDRLDVPFNPCVCGRSKSTDASMYGNKRAAKAIAPNKLDVYFGLLVSLAASIGLILAKIAVLVLVMYALILATIVVLSVYRLVRKHGLFCSIRWSFLVVFGIGRWL